MAGQALVAPELGREIAAQVLVVARAVAVPADLAVLVGVVDPVAQVTAVPVEAGQLQEQRQVGAPLVVPPELALAARAQGQAPRPRPGLGQVLVLELVLAPRVVRQGPPVPALAGQARAPRLEPGPAQAPRLEPGPAQRVREREPAWVRGPRREVVRLQRPRHPLPPRRPRRPCQPRPRRPL